MDLTVAELMAVAPYESFTPGVGDITISMKNLMGEDALADSDMKVSEFVAKLLDICRKAQLDHNAVPDATPIATFNAPTFNSPVAVTGGGFVARRNYSLTVAVPLEMDSITAV